MDARKHVGGEQPGGQVQVGSSLRAEAQDVLSDVLVWQHHPARWQQVAGIVEAMVAALAAGDEAALRDATLDLELASPSRATRIGTEPVVPAPEPVRVRTNQLIFSLGGPPPDGHQPEPGSAQRPAQEDRPGGA